MASTRIGTRRAAILGYRLAGTPTCVVDGTGGGGSAVTIAVEEKPFAAFLTGSKLSKTSLGLSLKTIRTGRSCWRHRMPRSRMRAPSDVSSRRGCLA